MNYDLVLNKFYFNNCRKFNSFWLQMCHVVEIIFFTNINLLAPLSCLLLTNKRVYEQYETLSSLETFIFDTLSHIFKTCLEVHGDS